MKFNDAMMINCNEARNELPLYVGGDLEPGADERVERHLDGCGACREAHAAARRARLVLREHFASPELELHQPELWSAVRAGLLEHGLIRSEVEAPAGGDLQEEVSVGPPARRGQLLRFVPMAAAAAALFMFGMQFGPDQAAEGPGSESGPGAGELVENVTPHVGPRGASPLNTEGEALGLGEEALVLESTSTSGMGAVQDPSPGRLVPLQAGEASMVFEASPWLGEVVPLSAYPQGGATAVGFTSPRNYRADGIR